eukprot:TRINITY_DN13273_c0_g5_i5.p1 TRINITY_DN13273_c0_g5~~TRINITY_DN13273_c0_g5_i5.p1  ORF type:complete len:218 (+),score=36.00 TRINITY_DN13273_c0_g5_i5:139-792(+)
MVSNMKSEVTEALLDASGMLKETPRVPLMKLKCAKAPGLIPASSAIIKEQPLLQLDCSLTLMQINKVSFKKPETVQIDSPCESEDDEELISQVTPNNPSLTAQTTNPDSKTKISKTKEDERKGEGSSLVAKNNEGREASNGTVSRKNTKVLKAQKNLMQALFEIGACCRCKKQIPYNADMFRNTCGHVFHSACIESMQECTGCGQKMEGLVQTMCPN